jgi:hypothetical protein
VTAPSHAACDAFTLALARQWPRHSELPPRIIRLADRLRLTDRRVERYLPENSSSDKAEGIDMELAHCRAELLWAAKREVVPYATIFSVNCQNVMISSKHVMHANPQRSELCFTGFVVETSDLGSEIIPYRTRLEIIKTKLIDQ